MTKLSNALLAGVFATSMIVAPAAFAQTPETAQSTGGAKALKDQADMDATRMDPAVPGAGTTAAAEPTGKGKIEADTTARQPENNEAVPGAMPSSSSSSNAGTVEPSGKGKIEADTTARQPENNEAVSGATPSSSSSSNAGTVEPSGKGKIEADTTARQPENNAAKAQ